MMEEIAEWFQNRKPNQEKLKQYGFLQWENEYLYHTRLVDGQLDMAVRVRADGEVTTGIRDCDLQQEYVLHRIAAAEGPFVGRVRQEYEQVLRQIADTCFIVEHFTEPVTETVLQYVREVYGDEPEFLWPKFPQNAVWRRKDTRKWYGVLLTVSKRKLGLDAEDRVEIIDLRIEPEELAGLLDDRKYYPGYHMNKKHWYTMMLDGSVPAEEICRRIDTSYRLAAR